MAHGRLYWVVKIKLYFTKRGDLDLPPLCHQPKLRFDYVCERTIRREDCNYYTVHTPTHGAYNRNTQRKETRRKQRQKLKKLRNVDYIPRAARRGLQARCDMLETATVDGQPSGAPHIS